MHLNVEAPGDECSPELIGEALGYGTARAILAPSRVACPSVFNKRPTINPGDSQLA
jgi:hypothetical protein